MNTEDLSQFEAEELAPTWESLMPVYFEILENGKEEGKKKVKEEILRCVRTVDSMNGKYLITKEEAEEYKRLKEEDEKGRNR